MATVHILGCGGHARSVADVLLDNEDLLELVFVDANARPNETILGFPVVGLASFAKASRFALGIGVNNLREAAFLSLESELRISAISRRAYLGRCVELGEAIFIGHGAHIGPLASVGSNSIINTGAILDHESVVGRSSHVGPGSTISGRAVIGERVFLGAGCTVIDGVSICADVTVGANSTVVRNIEAPGLYVGSPARRIR